MSFSRSASTQCGAVAAVTAVGICLLLPYNCFLQAQPYFQRYLFAGREFGFISMICFNLPQTIVAIALSKGTLFTLQSRMFVAFMSYVFFCATFMAIPSLAEVLPSDAVYLLTLVSIAYSAMGNSLMQTSLLGLTATMGEKLSKAVMSGIGVSGLISFFWSLLFDAVLTQQGFIGEEKQIWMLLASFSGCGIFVLVTIWIFHWYLCRRHAHVKDAVLRLEGRRHTKLLGIEFDPNCDLEVLLATPPPSPPSVFASPGSMEESRMSTASERSEDVLAEAWTERELRMHAFNVWLTFAVTLTIFPGVTTHWNPMPGSFFENSPDRLISLLIGTFQVFDVVGRYMADWFTEWIPPKKLVIYAVLRVLFIPVFMLGQLRPGWSPIWGSDLGRILLVASMACSNGLVCSCAMMFGPSSSLDSHKEVAGSVMSTALLLGLLSGSLCALLTQACS